SWNGQNGPSIGRITCTSSGAPRNASTKPMVGASWASANTSPSPSSPPLQAPGSARSVTRVYICAMTSSSVSFPKPCGWLACCTQAAPLLLFGQYKPDRATPASNPPREVSHLPADFLAFFDEFHADTAYHMTHIHFPLEGLPA